MATKRKYTMPFRRKREGRTNYKKRLTLLKSRRLRLVIRPSLKNMTAQIIGYEADGDRIFVGVNSSSLHKLGWKLGCGNLPAAYLTGYLLGKKMQKTKSGPVVLDSGLCAVVKGSRMFAVVKGAKEAGIDLPVDEVMLPSDERVQGNHIAAYAKDGPKPAHQFAAVKKAQVELSQVNELVSSVKKKIDTL